MEDRCNHLTKVKGKWEQSLDEVEDSLERGKKARGDVEELKRRLLIAPRSTFSFSTMTKLDIAAWEKNGKVVINWLIKLANDLWGGARFLSRPR